MRACIRSGRFTSDEHFGFGQFFLSEQSGQLVDDGRGHRGASRQSVRNLREHIRSDPGRIPSLYALEDGATTAQTVRPPFKDPWRSLTSKSRRQLQILPPATGTEGKRRGRCVPNPIQ